MQKYSDVDVLGDQEPWLELSDAPLSPLASRSKSKRLKPDDADDEGVGDDLEGAKEELQGRLETSMAKHLGMFREQFTSAVAQRRATDQAQMLWRMDTIRKQKGQQQYQSEQHWLGRHQSLGHLDERTAMQGRTSEESQQLLREQMRRWQYYDANHPIAKAEAHACN